MRICQLVPGSGGTFYCQNCLRDYTLVRALQREGQEAVLLPLYLPPLDSNNILDHSIPVFFGGINVYLQQRFSLFRKTPRWLDWLFDTPLILKLAAAQEGSTNAAQLGPMTLSMLEGRHGYQQKEFDRLITWLVHHEKPDVVHLSNALLLGLAVEIKHVLKVPVVCTLQDEEPWVEAMPSPWKERCWNAMVDNARYVDAFISTSYWYADRMRIRMHIPADQIRVIYPGVEVNEEPAADLVFDPPTIGYLTRLNVEQGFGALIEAFIQLKQEDALKNLRLRATGGSTHMDQPFLHAVHDKLRNHGFEQDVDFVSDFHSAQRRDFLRSISVLSTPAPHGEAFGIQLIDAMAQGVPVVQPNVGAYPEIIQATGGGVLYDQEDPHGLADALRSLLCDPEKARALGQNGRNAVRGQFNVDRVAREMTRIYELVIAQAGK
ncbi:MAG TPA: glycosyltransferase family 4 protein [Candidatus Hydrogenedentes bacterium]|nr:glycosyltransferase family 4 protein [Candidatus Hydrogenedentota bacterium]